jgi:hypothetical protein
MRLRFKHDCDPLLAQPTAGLPLDQVAAAGAVDRVIEVLDASAGQPTPNTMTWPPPSSA